VVSDGHGGQANGTVTVEVLASALERANARSELVGAQGLSIDAPQAQAPSFGSVSLTPFTGVRLITDAFFQSLQILKLPLVLLAAAVLWALTLGGFLNVGGPMGLLRLLFPRLQARLLAVVLRGAEEPLEVRAEPDGDSDLVHYASPTLPDIISKGRSVVHGGIEWVPVVTDRGEGWADVAYLTEELRDGDFERDNRPPRMLAAFVEALETGDSVAEFVSERGLFISFSATPPIHRTLEDLRSAETVVWRQGDKVYLAVAGSFTEAVAAPLAAAYRTPHHDVRVDSPVLASAMIPIQFRNFHFISIGSPGALDSWMVFFEYRSGKPRTVAVSRDG
jgi:hypothetical protein